MSVHEYSLKFTQLYLYAPQINVYMKSMMSFFVSGLSHLSSKEGKAAILIGYMNIERLMIHVQQVDEDKLRDKKEFQNKKAKTTGNESGKWNINVNRSSFQKEKMDLLNHLLVHLHQ